VTTNAISVAENNESIRKNTTSGLECASCAPPDLECAEALGGGSEYPPLWRLPLWPFSLIRLFRQEED
jgi:hypothetical protein